MTLGEVTTHASGEAPRGSASALGIPRLVARDPLVVDAIESVPSRSSAASEEVRRRMERRDELRRRSSFANEGYIVEGEAEHCILCRSIGGGHQPMYGNDSARIESIGPVELCHLLESGGILHPIG